MPGDGVEGGVAGGGGPDLDVAPGVTGGFPDSLGDSGDRGIAAGFPESPGDSGRRGIEGGFGESAAGFEDAPGMDGGFGESFGLAALPAFDGKPDSVGCFSLRSCFCGKGGGTDGFSVRS